MKILGRRISLSSSPFIASLTVVISLGVFMAIFWAFNEYEAYTESIENIQQSYRARYRERVREEFGKVVDFIEYRRSQAEEQIETEIRDRVQSAYSIASHMYSRHKDEMPVSAIKSLVVEVLRPIRWNNGTGYYFAGSLKNSTIDLYADDPFYEGKKISSDELRDVRKKFIDISAMVKEKGAGIYTYNWTKPEYEGRFYPKISFVKYFKPFDWYIGAGNYLDDLEEVLQEDVLARIRNIRFGKDGEIFGFRNDGTIICHRQEMLIGRSIKDFSVGDHHFGLEMLEKGSMEDGEGFVVYSTGASEINRKLAYVKSYSSWGWIFVAVMGMDDMEKAIEDEKTTYIAITLKNTTLFITLFIIAVGILLASSYFYSLSIKHGISLFTDFFRKAADEKIRIEETQLAFAEFEDLGNLANQMVDDRIHKELLLRRDELRLDTLLQLGMMEERCFQDKYDFILERIIRITRSEAGYLALVNDAQSHVNLYSFFEVNKKMKGKAKVTGISLPLGKAGAAGLAVTEGKPLVNNDCDHSEHRLFPYDSLVKTHLDVPIFNSGKIVIVAGVCNTLDGYDNGDVRQITMLLEGLWLHVLKICAEEEMARLERQIIAVSEEERSTIGRDLHDDLGSHLSGVELLCMVLQKKLHKEDQNKAEELGAIRNLIREAIDITKRLAQGLYPVHVVEHGLVSAVEELKVEVENLFDVDCILSFSIEDQKLDNSVAIHLYYITREAVFNAARHGRPDKINILLESRGSRLLLEVVDDGSGFTTESTQYGIGLHTMKYRAKAIGASLLVQPEEDSGTRIFLNGENQI